MPRRAPSCGENYFSTVVWSDCAYFGYAAINQEFRIDGNASEGNYWCDGPKGGQLVPVPPPG